MLSPRGMNSISEIKDFKYESKGDSLQKQKSQLAVQINESLVEDPENNERLRGSENFLNKMLLDEQNNNPSRTPAETIMDKNSQIDKEMFDTVSAQTFFEQRNLSNMSGN